ncbi:protein trichome birefringence-like 26 [Zingiber officinale]|uniref:Trichome birefringence-like N-terminal domain-containing protein n=1 Tax=Zingiber officinale TaxID=94328 RepID=A0A8J5FN70_ZINOF|nr:protein trichome birefringence-like 26 [Zingiber officinale]KAG6491693.1 hypothetical protein ZIOFF_046629 [Zingiber officinale]
MGSDWGQCQQLQRKSKQFLVKFLGLALLVGLSSRLLFSGSPMFTPASELPSESIAERSDSTAGVSEEAYKVSASTDKSSIPVPEAVTEDQVSKDKCDLFTGEWIPNPTGPTYTNESCRFIESPQNCMVNGRPDTGYLFWRWKPHGCDVPPFSAKKFLGGMQNKCLALIGDSIFRNHAQSLLCLLSKVEEPVLVFHDDQYRSRRWHFPSHNFTLSLIWSPFLLKAETFEDDNGVATSESKLHADTLDETWTSQYNSFDYVVISGGQWFLKAAIYVENNAVIGCHYCPKLNLSELGVQYVYKKTLNSLFHFINTSEHKPTVIYRTWTPDHFEFGRWSSGGVCNRTTPYKVGEYTGTDLDRAMQNIELEEFTKAIGRANGAKLKLLDTFKLSLLRPDAHPGPYRTFHPFGDDKNKKVQNDCLHWCLPGAIDTWNELIVELIKD